ncbi:MAG: hypothetical protein ACFCVC_07125 [Acidimicrobiia bacterium]
MERLIEIRVHGVSGTSPEDMLEGPAEQVPGIPGDVWKRSDREDGVRAVRWSNLTSGSPISALWLTLLPYMMLNLAGWALPPSGRWRHRAGVVSIRAAGLALTMVFSTVTAVGFIGVGGYQVLRGAVGTGWALVLGVVASLVVVLGMWLATSTVGDDARADRVYLRSLHVAVALWAVWWTLVAAAREAYPGVDEGVLMSGGLGVGWPIPVIAGATIVLVGLIEGLERFARPVGIGLAVMSGVLLVLDSIRVVTAPGVGVAQPDRLRQIDDPLTLMVQWYALLALAAMVLSVSRRYRTAGPVIGTFIALAGSTGASVGAALIWVSAKATGVEPPSGIAPIAEAFLTGTALVGAVLGLVVLGGSRSGEPALRGVYESAVRIRNGLWPVLVAVPAVTGAILAMTVATLPTGRAPEEFAAMAAVSGTVMALGVAGGLLRMGLRGPAVALAAVPTAIWVAVSAGFVDVGFTTVAVTLTLTIPLVLVATRVVGALRDRDKRRLLAVPWDVGSYFARRFHPFAPPSYRDQAVADLEAAVEHYRGQGFPVVIGAHSQGTVVCAAAVSDSGEGMATALLTYGSPLASLHARFFPRYFTDEYLTGVATKAGAGWINLWRPTDPISGPLSPGPEDRRIDDPRVRGHGGYWRRDEPEFARALADLAAGIDQLDPGSLRRDKPGSEA